MPENKEFDLNLLRVFDAIYRLGTITKAAEQLNVSQPAVSHALARLRDLYDDQLFSRSPKGMKPTPIATDIALNVSQALQQSRISLAKAGRFNPETSDRHFRFVMQDGFAAVLLPRLLSMLQEEAPGMTLQVFQDPRRDAVEELVAGSVDFVIDNFVPTHAQVMQMKIAEEKYVCAVRQDHPDIGKKITLDQYLQHGHIHASSRKGGKSYVDLALQSLGAQRKIVFQTQHYLETPFALSGTDLILTTTNSIANAHNLKTLPLPFEVSPINISMFWHASRDADPASCWLRTRIIELYSDMRVGKSKSKKAHKTAG
ncbi:MAG: LysR family transcriptional regulator [Halopseudomonas sp.]